MVQGDGFASPPQGLVQCPLRCTWTPRIHVIRSSWLFVGVSVTPECALETLAPRRVGLTKLALWLGFEGLSAARLSRIAQFEWSSPAHTETNCSKADFISIISRSFSSRSARWRSAIAFTCRLVRCVSPHWPINSAIWGMENPRRRDWRMKRSTETSRSPYFR